MSQQMNLQRDIDFSMFQEGCIELVALGEKFITGKVFLPWQMSRFAEMRDRLQFYLYCYFRELHDRIFQDAPVLPRVSVWQYILHQILWVPERMLNRIWWPKYGPAVEHYMRYYMERMEAALAELSVDQIVSETTVEKQTHVSAQRGHDSLIS